VRELGAYCETKKTTVADLVGRAHRAGRVGGEAGAEG